MIRELFAAMSQVWVLLIPLSALILESWIMVHRVRRREGLPGLRYDFARANGAIGTVIFGFVLVLWLFPAFTMTPLHEGNYYTMAIGTVLMFGAWFSRDALLLWFWLHAAPEE